MTFSIDAHQHFWDTARVPLPWLRAEHAPIAGPYDPADLEPLLRPAGVDRTILVQSACSDADTEQMFAFGPERLVCGSDWPVALLNDDYGRVWTETRRVLDAVAPRDQDQMLQGTACRLYRLAEVPVGAH
jgi:predicted TIM-barrel fold metal-dependent hydrolase